MTPTLLSKLGMTWEDAWLTVITAFVIYFVMILFSRVFGQRQFAQSSTYDMAFIFALGSLTGRVLLIRTSLGNAVLALLTMFVLHACTGWLHHNLAIAHRVIQNRPVLLVVQGTVLDGALGQVHMSRMELYQELRRQGHGSVEGIAAAVLERNGGVSVLAKGTELDPELFQEVVGRERIAFAGG